MLDDAGVHYYMTYVYSSSYELDTVVGEARGGWIESNYAYFGDEVELLLSCGPVEDSWTNDELPDDTSDIIVDNICSYAVYIYIENEDYYKNLLYGESWETVWNEYIIDTAAPVNESDIPIDDYVTLDYLGDEIKVYRYLDSQRWRFDYEVWD